MSGFSKMFFRRAFAAAALTVAACLVSGCGMQQSYYAGRAQELLRDKYNEAFSVVSYQGGGFFDESRKMVMRSNAYQDAVFECEVGKDGSWEDDGYVARRVCTDVESGMESVLSRYSGRCLVHVSPLADSLASSNANMSLGEFMQLKPSDRFVVYLLLSPQDDDPHQLYGSISDMVAGNTVMSGTIQFTVVDSRALKKAEEFFRENANPDDEYARITESAGVTAMRFSNGSLETDESVFESEVNLSGS